MTIIQGRPRYAVTTTEGTPVSSTGPGSFSIDDSQGVDLIVQDSDVYIAFGTSDHDFDASKAIYYPVTASFGDEVIGPPKGATDMYIQAVQGTATVQVQTAALPEYGGAERAWQWGATDVTVDFDLPSSIALGSFPVTVLLKIRTTTVPGSALTVLSLHNGDTVTREFSLELLAHQNDEYRARINGSAGQSSVSSAGLSYDNKWMTVALTIHSDKTSEITVWDGTTSTASGKSVAIADFAESLTTLSIGSTQTFAADYENGEITELAVYHSAHPTGTEWTNIRAIDGDPFPQAVDNPDKILVYWSVQANRNTQDWVSGLEYTVSQGDDANLTLISADLTGRNIPNRLSSTDDVANIDFDDTGSTETDLTTNSVMGMHRAQSHVAVQYESGITPIDPTASPFKDEAAGVFLVGAGPAASIVTEVAADVASEEGTLNVCPLKYEA